MAKNNISKPVVTVILGVYDEPAHIIDRTVDSLLKQSYKNFELLITVDNPKNLAGITYLNTIKDKRVRIILNKKNLGYGISKRKAIKEAKGKYIAVTDSELFYQKDKLKKQVAYAEKHNSEFLFTEFHSVDEIKGKRWVNRFPKNANFHNHFFIKSCYCFPTLLARTDILQKNNYTKAVVPDDFHLYFKVFRKGITFDILHESLTDVYNKPYYRKKAFYLRRHLADAKNMLKLLITNMDLFYSAKGYWKKVVKKIFTLGIFIGFYLLDKIGVFNIIWEHYLMKKWKAQ